MEGRSPVKRINVMIAEHQYERLSEAGINISGLIRDLIEDHISDHVINLRVSSKTYELYNRIVANTGATDEDIEPLLVDILRKLLNARLDKIKELRTEIGD
jgi:post-segregation antitoxin (ccd killing protein)